MIRGLVTTSIETLDNSITQEVTNHLFEEPKKPFSGMDLISLNLQRARDHGIPPYNDYREKCNLTRARNFDDLVSDIPAKIVERLKKVYELVHKQSHNKSETMQITMLIALFFFLPRITGALMT